MGIVERFLLNQEEIVQNFKSAEIAFSIQNYDSAELICKRILADNQRSECIAFSVVFVTGVDNGNRQLI